VKFRQVVPDDTKSQEVLKMLIRLNYLLGMRLYPVTRWFVLDEKGPYEGPGEFQGFARPDEIWIADWLCGRELLKTVVHEFFHYWRFHEHPRLWVEEKLALQIKRKIEEENAEAFSEFYTQILLGEKK